VDESSDDLPVTAAAPPSSASDSRSPAASARSLARPEADLKSNFLDTTSTSGSKPTSETNSGRRNSELKIGRKYLEKKSHVEFVFSKKSHENFLHT
jgi:hypothetical protein